jgi:hypothetical protein
LFVVVVVSGTETSAAIHQEEAEERTAIGTQKRLIKSAIIQPTLICRRGNESRILGTQKVVIHRDGKDLTLEQVFESLHLTGNVAISCVSPFLSCVFI